jgi:hypothetical protein
MSRGGRGGFGRGGGAPLSVASILYLIARPVTGRGFGRGGGPPRDLGPPDTVLGAYSQPRVSLN